MNGHFLFPWNRQCGLCPFTVDGIDMGKLIAPTSEDAKERKDECPRSVQFKNVKLHLAFIESVIGNEKVNCFRQHIANGTVMIGKNLNQMCPFSTFIRKLLG